MDIVERLNIRADTYNTGHPVNPESVGTLGYYSVYDAKLDTEVVQEIERLRSILAKHAECETMINQELKDVRAKLAVFRKDEQ